MTVHNIYNYHCFMDVLKILKLRTPISLYAEFNLSNRKETLLLTPSPDTYFIYKSSILWNYLRNKLNMKDFSMNISHFKSQIKSLILSVQQSHHETEWSVHNFEIWALMYISQSLIFLTAYYCTALSQVLFYISRIGFQHPPINQFI